MSKTIAVVQSNYIPWRGYFDLINSVDEFILYDDVQYTIRDWRNRNIIKTSSGLSWLTIPVEIKGKYFQKIKDTRVSDPTWARKHWASIIHNYSRAKYFPMHRELFEELYLRSQDRLLSQINYRFMVAICRVLGIATTISWSMDYNLIGDKTERLVHLCQQARATVYLSGPAAKAYLEIANDRKNTVDDIFAVINDKDYAFTLSPEKVFKTAVFMGKVGTIKEPPAKWQDLFFPDIHSLPGD